MKKKALVEAALFVSDKPLSIGEIAKNVRLSTEDVKNCLNIIKKELSREDRGIELVETLGKFELRVKEEYRELVAGFAPLADMSDGMMRTLSYVVLNQPIKQSIIVKFQGNKTYGYVKSLEEKGLIKTEKFGRTKIITIADEFERYFGKSVEDVKKALLEKLKPSP